MDRRSVVRRWLRLREREGLTYAQLSGRSGIPANSLAHWAWKLRKEVSEPSSDVEFVELVPSRREQGALASRIVIELGHNRRVIADVSTDAEALARIVRALERC